MKSTSISCPNCGANYKVTAELMRRTGGNARCAVCKETFRIEFDSSSSSTESTLHNDEASSTSDNAHQPTVKQLSSNYFDESTLVVNDIPEMPTFVGNKMPDQDDTQETLSAEKKHEDASLSALLHERISKNKLPTLPIQNIQLKKLWLIGSIVLALTFLFQLAWLKKDHPTVHSGISKVCKVVGCTPPALRFPDAISIANRVFTEVKGEAGTYKLQLQIINHAPYPQPYPTIELSLLDSKGVVRARNQLAHKDYSLVSVTDLQLMPPKEKIDIEFSIHSSLADTSGFMLDFL